MVSARAMHVIDHAAQTTIQRPEEDPSFGRFAVLCVSATVHAAVLTKRAAELRVFTQQRQGNISNCSHTIDQRGGGRPSPLANISSRSRHRCSRRHIAAADLGSSARNTQPVRSNHGCDAGRSAEVVRHWRRGSTSVGVGNPGNPPAAQGALMLENSRAAADCSCAVPPGVISCRHRRGKARLASQCRLSWPIDDRHAAALNRGFLGVQTATQLITPRLAARGRKMVRWRRSAVAWRCAFS